MRAKGEKQDKGPSRPGSTESECDRREEHLFPLITEGEIKWTVSLYEREQRVRNVAAEEDAEKLAVGVAERGLVPFFEGIVRSG